MANQAPEKTFRVGLCSASVFKNVVDGTDGGPKKTFRAVSMQRRYRKQDGSWESTTSFGLGELPQAMRAMELAQGYVESIEAEVTS